MPDDAIQFQYQSGWNGVSYDANGNLLYDTFNTYTWDVYGNLASANGATIVYDAFGRMVENHSGAYQFVYAPNGGTQPLADMQGQSLLGTFLPLPSGAIAAYNSSGLLQYMHADWLGSARLSSTPGRAPIPAMSYAPFGEGYAGGQQYEQFTGINAGTVFDTENQSGSLEDFMFRRYSPVQGRWISPDPAGLGAVDPSNPQSWNRYAYVINNPLNWVDPLGLQYRYIPPNPPGAGDEFDWLELSFWSDISGEDAFYVLAFPGAGGPCAFGLCGDINAAANNWNCIITVNCRGIQVGNLGKLGFQHCDAGVTDANGNQHSLTAGPDPPNQPTNPNTVLNAWDTPLNPSQFTGNTTFTSTSCSLAGCLINSTDQWNASPIKPLYGPTGISIEGWAPVGQSGENSNQWLMGTFQGCGVSSIGINQFGSTW